MNTEADTPDDIQTCEACDRIVSDEEDFTDDRCDACRCDHRWQYVRDWYGDANVYNGTADCSHWRCTKCDAESSGRPEGWAPDYPEYEYEDRE